MTQKITGVVLTFNSEATIAATLTSLRLAVQEILVVDSGSTDRTLEIAKALADRIEHHPFSGYSAQRTFAFSLVTQGWILSLDADEELTPSLAREIEKLRPSLQDSADSSDSSAPSSVQGFNIPILTLFQNRPLRFGGTYPDLHLRLFRCGSYQVQNLAVHEGMTVQGQVRNLSHPVLHRPYRDLHHMMEKMCSYSRLAGDQLFADDRRSRALAGLVILRPLYSFFVKYVLRLGFLDGWRGLVYHVCHSFYVFLKYARLRELYEVVRNKPEDTGNKA